MFSRSDYELASRLLGMPVPETPEEQAMAAPIVGQVLRDYLQMRPPTIGGEPNATYTGATRSLNAPPDTSFPMAKAQLASRLRVEEQEPSQDEYLRALLMEIMQDPSMIQELMMIMDQMDAQEQQHMDELSSQRPAEYDTPSMGSNYSMLNAPSSNGIPPSVQFQALS